MHSYYFNIGDYRRDTGHLRPIEHYIYRTLIDWYYLDETPIPTDENQVLRRLSLDSEKMPNLQIVLQDFFIPTNEGFRHKRIDHQIDEYLAICERNRINGSLGGRRKKKRSLTGSKANGKQTINHKPETINIATSKKSSIKKPIPEDFKISKSVRVWAKSKNIHNIDDHLEPFIITCKAKGYKYKDWDMAFMNAVRNDWAKVGHGSDDGFQLAD